MGGAPAPVAHTEVELGVIAYSIGHRALGTMARTLGFYHTAIRINNIEMSYGSCAGIYFSVLEQDPAHEFLKSFPSVRVVLPKGMEEILQNLENHGFVLGQYSEEHRNCNDFTRAFLLCVNADWCWPHHLDSSMSFIRSHGNEATLRQVLDWI